MDGIAAAARLRFALEALRRRQRVFALDQQAVRRQSNAARMADAEPRGIALMRCPEREPLVGFLVERGLHVGGARKLGIEGRLAAVGAGEDRRGGLLEGQRRMGRCRAGEHPPIVVVRGRRPAIDDDGVLARAHLEGEASGMRLHAQRTGRRCRHIGDDERAPSLHARIARVRRGAERRAADVVISEHGGERVGRGRAAAVEAHHGAVAEAEEADHRHGAVDGVGELLRRHAVARHEALPERQEIEQEIDERGRVARDMPAVGHDLTVELLAERLQIAVDHRLLLGDAEPGIDERHERYETRRAVRSVTIARREIAKMRRQRMEEGLVGFRIAGIENHHGVGQPGDDPPPDDLRLPGEPAHGLMQSQKVADQRLGLLARQLAARGAQMPEPAEAVKLARPAFRRRRDFERRLRVELDQAAGEAEMAVVDLGGEARIGGAQILWRKQELLGLRARIAEARHAQEHEAAEGRPARAQYQRATGPGRHEGQSPCSIISNTRPRLQSGASGPPRTMLGHCRTASGQDQEASGLSGRGYCYLLRFRRAAKNPSMPLHSGVPRSS